MNSFYLASAILRGKWLIEPSFVESQGAIIANLLNNHAEFAENEPDHSLAFAVDSKDVTGVKYSWWDGFDRAPKGSIAVIKIMGALMKNDQECGPMGTQSIGKIIREASAHKNINGIVLHIDSPGGTVDGTEALANIIKNAQKPVVTYVDGLMASAALWIGSSANEIIASTDTDEIGSVGVLLSFADVQPYWERLGVKFHTITASTSPEKVKVWEDIRSGRYDDYKKNVLDVLDKKFMDTVRENRQNVQDKHLTGKVFFAKDVMDVFVDSIGSLDDAIMRASELSQEETSGSNGSQAKTNNMSKNYLKIQKALGEDSLELEADGGRTFTPEEMEAIESALPDADASDDDADDQDDAADDADDNDDDASDDSATDVKDQEIARLKAENQALKKAPGARNKKVVKTTDSKSTKTDGFETYTNARNVWNAIDNLLK